MPYQPVAVESFGGLNLTDDPGTVGWSGAVDLLNVTLEPGTVRSRDGYTNYLLVASGAAVARIGLDTTGRPLFVDEAGDMNVVTVSTGGRTTLAGTLQSTGFGYARFGGAAGSRTYYGAGNTATQFSRITEVPALTATITNPGTTDTSTGGTVELAVSPTTNRLVWCFQHRVWFSDAGDPETYGANNYVDVDPGDGEYITAAISWRDLVFVFKESKFFVFYGESTDSSGNPIFNYRKVVTRGCAPAGGATSSEDAVYFTARDGVYYTTGGEPVCISDPVEALWGLSPLPALTSLTKINNVYVGGCCWSRGRLHVTVCLSGGAPTHTLVWHPKLGWSAWDVAGYSPITLEDNATLLFGTLAGGQIAKVGTFLTQATDAGTTITSRYRSGFSDLGSTDEKRIPAWTVQGSGSPTLKLSTEFGSLETGAAVTLGTAPAIDEDRRRYAVRGRQVSWQLGGTTAWSVNNLVAHVADKKAPGDT